MTPDHALLDGRYRLVEQIGRGGTATLWRGYDERLNRTVAVKLFNPAAVDATGVYAEAERLAQLSHPHVATVFDAGRTHGQPYLVMEFVRGRPLSELLADGGLPW